MNLPATFFPLFLTALLTRPWDPWATIPVPAKTDPDFPAELVTFTSYANNPVFTGTGTNTWDQKIRERGYILRENGTYHLWFTGYRDGKEGLVTSFG